GHPTTDSGHFCNYLPSDAWTVLVEPEELQEQAKHYLERVIDARGLFSLPGAFQQLMRFPSVTIATLPVASMEPTCHLRVESVERFSGDVTKLRGELEQAASGDRVLIACHNDGERKRLAEVLLVGEGRTASLELVVGKVRAGFRMVDAGIMVLSDHELFHRQEARQILPRRRLESRAIDSFLDLA